MTEPWIPLGQRQISASAPCYVIAEIGVNHNGRLELAHQMIDSARASGADAVKFQTFRSEDLVGDAAPKAAYQSRETGAGSQLEMLRQLELPADGIRELREHCSSIGLDFMSTAFDASSLDEVVALKPVCLKWPSGELNNLPLLRKAAAAGLPVMLSTGMGSIAEIAAALDSLQAAGCDDVIILQCVSNYPARIEDQNLRSLPAMSAVFGKPVGFSDHTEGPFAAIAARALGMAVLEKHFTLDRSMPGPDHRASTEPDEFANLTAILRQIEAGLGDGVKRPVQSETDVRAVVRKSLVFVRDLPKGHRLSAADLTAKRPAGGIPPDRVDTFASAILQVAVSKDEQLSWHHIS